jgi:hypothetical protein
VFFCPLMHELVLNWSLQRQEVLLICRRRRNFNCFLLKAACVLRRHAKDFVGRRRQVKWVREVLNSISGINS